ncbi:chemotaxis protein CheA [Tropicimonas sediminicola]|uniref:Chemotaxis protein CheA n=1 Tax=Tropicimonas sediminicola TaxID=1031541 RepID=A0A239K728_9RHOB|nr:chemotaxis protein CheA [Tropicimonas sediminicola]SNT13558.1 two-component system, chemotaxis family, sensor kinase CheA [Tropicimonas sediminicola]
MTTPDPMAEIRASFFVECEELMEALQDGLTMLDGGDADDETVNICFRAVHSMKGGAGAFGLDDLVRFSHRYETVLDEVRAGRLEPGHDVVLLFMRAADILSDIVHYSRDGLPVDPDKVEPTLRELEALISDEAEEEEAEVTDFQPMTLALPFGGPPADRVVRIRFAPEPDLFTSGNEPVHLLRALAALGEMQITPDLSEVPTLDALDPEAACLAWEIVLTTNRDRAEIEETFEFVEGLCKLSICEEQSGLSLPCLPGLPPLAMPPAPDAGVSPSAEVRPRLTLTAPPDCSDPEEGTPPPDTAKTHAPQPAPATPIAVESPVATAARPATTPPKATVRVDLDRIERLVNLVGELVINQAMLSQSVAQAGLPTNSPVVQGLEDFMQLTRDIQDSVMMIRAQPVKSLFQRLARIVRDTSAAVGKPVRFVTRGEATEVDKTVIERLADPLTHMIRNAVDHGLERPEARLAAGKPSEGCITLSAAHRSGRVVIEVMDDGGGIDRPRVQAIAEERGLIDPGQAMTDAEIDALLFMPGFSTVKQVSNLSGRGVGMDVVRKSIQDLGGRVSISSSPGKGTCFSISLPLTLAVLDGMVVDVAGEALVVPIGAIAETMAYREQDIRSVGPRTRVLHIRDSFVPLLDLGVELGFRPAKESNAGSVVLLVANEGETLGALIVDAIHEQRQVVIKGLQQGYGNAPGIAAATILGDGQVALILDPVDMMAKAGTRPGQTQPALAPTG